MRRHSGPGLTDVLHLFDQSESKNSSFQYHKPEFSYQLSKESASNNLTLEKLEEGHIIVGLDNSMEKGQITLAPSQPKDRDAKEVPESSQPEEPEIIHEDDQES